MTPPTTMVSFASFLFFSSAFCFFASFLEGVIAVCNQSKWTEEGAGPLKLPPKIRESVCVGV